MKITYKKFVNNTFTFSVLLLNSLVLSASSSEISANQNSCFDNDACPKMLEYSLLSGIKADADFRNKIVFESLIRISNKSKRKLTTSPKFRFSNTSRTCSPSLISMEPLEVKDVNISCDSPGSPFSLFDSSGRSNSVIISGSATPPVSPKYLYVFVTSSTHQGNFTGLSGANTICGNLADSASSAPWAGKLNQSDWVAILSDKDNSLGTDAKDLISGSEASDFGVKLSDGTDIASSFSDLFNLTSINAPINKDENRNELSVAPTYVWTGTAKNGTGINFENCGRWTSGDTPYYGATGTFTSDTNWLYNSETGSSGNISCEKSYRLYCISTKAV